MANDDKQNRSLLSYFKDLVRSYRDTKHSPMPFYHTVKKRWQSPEATRFAAKVDTYCVNYSVLLRHDRQIDPSANILQAQAQCYAELHVAFRTYRLEHFQRSLVDKTGTANSDMWCSLECQKWLDAENRSAKALAAGLRIVATHFIGDHENPGIVRIAFEAAIDGEKTRHERALEDFMTVASTQLRRITQDEGSLEQADEGYPTYQAQDQLNETITKAATSMLTAAEELVRGIKDIQGQENLALEVNLLEVNLLEELGKMKEQLSLYTSYYNFANAVRDCVENDEEITMPYKEVFAEERVRRLSG